MSQLTWHLFNTRAWTYLRLPGIKARRPKHVQKKTRPSASSSQCRLRLDNIWEQAAHAARTTSAEVAKKGGKVSNSAEAAPLSCACQAQCIHFTDVSSHATALVTWNL